MLKQVVHAVTTVLSWLIFLMDLAMSLVSIGYVTMLSKSRKGITYSGNQ
jgi:hypothetical protein